MSETRLKKLRTSKRSCKRKDSPFSCHSSPTAYHSGIQPQFLQDIKEVYPGRHQYFFQYTFNNFKITNPEHSFPHLENQCLTSS